MEEQRLTLSIEEACKLLGISRNLGYEMARTGRLPTVRFGRRWLVPRQALYKLLEEAVVERGDCDGKG